MVKSENVKRITRHKDFELDENYLVFVGYSLTPSGFNIGTFTLSGYFDMYNSLPVEWEEDLIVFELPKLIV